MITRIVRMTFQKGKTEEFLHIFHSSCEKIRGSEGCTELKLYRDVDDPDIYITYSIWESVKHLNNYRNSELFKETWANVKPLFAAKPDAFSMVTAV
jgi:quinol monooxygenase YgiN